VKPAAAPAAEPRESVGELVAYEDDPVVAESLRMLEDHDPGDREAVDAKTTLQAVIPGDGAERLLKLRSSGLRVSARVRFSTSDVEGAGDDARRASRLLLAARELAWRDRMTAELLHQPVPVVVRSQLPGRPSGARRTRRSRSTRAGPDRESDEPHDRVARHERVPCRCPRRAAV
jgi:hypothetical protein